MDFSKIKEILSNAAKRAGITEYDAYFSHSENTSVEILKDEMSGFSSNDSFGIGFRCIVNGKFGQASCECITESELEELVIKAAQNAEYIECDDESIIFKGSDKYSEVCSDSFEIPKSGDLNNAALEIQDKTYKASKLVIDGTQSFAEASLVEVKMFNSYGLELCKGGGCVSYCACPVVSNGTESEDSYEVKTGKDFSFIDEVVQKSVDTAVAKLGADTVPSGKYNVVLSGKKFADIVAHFSSCFSAKSVKLGLSKIADKLGEKIASDIITITDDPFSDELCAKSAFDGEGVATYTKNIVENGVLKTFLYDLAMAKHFGVEPTGNGVRGYSSPVSISPFFLYVNKGDKSFNELLKDASDGLYVTQLKSFSASNTVTGDFSIESAGYLIKDGNLAEFVKSFTIAGNFFDLLCEVEALSNELHVHSNGVFRGLACPDALVRNISVAGK